MSRLRAHIRWILVKRNSHRSTHYAVDCPCRHCRRFNRWLADLKPAPEDGQR